MSFFLTLKVKWQRQSCLTRLRDEPARFKMNCDDSTLTLLSPRGRDLLFNQCTKAKVDWWLLLMCESSPTGGLTWFGREATYSSVCLSIFERSDAFTVPACKGKC